ncbi:MAG TPA: hypothetical protein VGI45_09405 [Terracidiphilus sp.]
MKRMFAVLAVGVVLAVTAFAQPAQLSAKNGCCPTCCTDKCSNCSDGSADCCSNCPAGCCK